MSIMYWDMFRCSSDKINEFTEALVVFIGKLVDDTVPKITLKTYPNQKPCVSHSIHDALNKSPAAYSSGLPSVNMEKYKAASYILRQMVRKVKRCCGENIQSQ